MASQPRDLLFDIDLDELKAIRAELEATEKEMLLAYNRALRRTAVTVKSIASKLGKNSIHAKQLKYIRKRLRDYIVNEAGKELKSLRFWFGLNDMSAHTLKGRMRSKSVGAVFTPSSGNLPTQDRNRGFVLTGGKIGKKRIMFERFGKQRGKYRVVRVPIAETMQNEIESKIYEELPEIFLRHYRTDLKGRIAMRKNGRK